MMGCGLSADTQTTWERSCYGKLAVCRTLKQENKPRKKSKVENHAAVTSPSSSMHQNVTALQYMIIALVLMA
jgi:hypothetical protein